MENIQHGAGQEWTQDFNMDLHFYNRRYRRKNLLEIGRKIPLNAWRPPRTKVYMITVSIISARMEIASADERKRLKVTRRKFL
jgi:hypothetical protein